MKRTLSLLGILGGLVLLVVCLYAISPYLVTKGVAEETAPATAKTPAAAGRNPAWAEKLERPGLPNLHKLSESLYRGAQPEPKETGLAELKKLGVKTIVNLRSLHGEKEEAAVAGLTYVPIRFNPLGAPEDDEILQFLNVVTDKSKTPVFVHCQHGADRTGTMCAVYRVIVQGWAKDEAVKEMKEGGYNFHESVYESYAQYILKMDVDKMKKALAKSAAKQP